MGVKSFYQEFKLKVSASRLFKALVMDSHEILPKVTPGIKNIEILEGGKIGHGCVYQANFPEGSEVSYIKHRLDEVDPVNLVCKATTFEGHALGHKHAKICYELKFEESGDGGCVVKVKTDYHSKSHGHGLTDEEVEERKEHNTYFYKACEQYLLANPIACT